MDREQLKRQVCDTVERRRADIIEIGEDIMRHPELGFKEFRTSRVVAQEFERLGLSCQQGLAITGVKATLKGGKPGPTVALIGELDSLIVWDHPQANPETGAAHACGHNAQIAGMLGAARALIETGAIDHLAGNLVFFAVPAEEYVEVEYRARLVQEGKLEFLGGKPELVRLGHFDDVDMAMMIHTTSNVEDKASVSASSNGCVVKLIRYLGRASHAGGAPHLGVNALSAAMLGLSAINAQRETFQDDDSIRVHPIITHGGDLVNIIPAEVRMETYVRGKTTDAILDADRKVDRALRAGALGMGAEVEIRSFPGYFPLVNSQGMAAIFKRNAAEYLFNPAEVKDVGHGAGSTDMGDLSYIMPALHPMITGAYGDFHSREWHIARPDHGYLAPAKALALTAIDLLWDTAAEARRVLETDRPRMTKCEYLRFQRAMFRTERYPGEADAASA
jgi:amidohydrolase